MINAPGVEAGAATNNAVDGVALGEQQFAEIRAVLARDAGYQCRFGQVLANFLLNA